MEESLVQLPSQRPSTASPRQADPSSANNSTAPPSTAQPHKPPAVPPLPLHPRPPMGTSSPSILVRDEDNAGSGATDWLHSDRRLSTSSPRGKRASIVSASRDMSSRGGIGGAGASTRRVSGAATSNTAPSAAISTEFSGPPGTSMEERPEMTQLTLAQLQYIKHIFEVYDFVRMPSQIVNMSVPPPAHAKAKKRKKNRRRRRPNSKHGSRHGANSARTAISSSSDEDEPIGGAALTLPPLRRNEEEARLYRRNLLFHLIEVRPGIDDEAGGRRRDKRRYFCIPKEEEGEEDESTTPALTAAGNSTSLQSSPPDLNMIDSQPEVEEEPEEAIALDYASQLVEAQAIIKEELTRMHEWKRQQAILAEETARERSRFPDAVPTGGATHNSSAEVQLASGDVILSSAGLPFFFFAEHIVGPFFTSFFPAPNVEEDLVATLRDANTPSARVLADIWGRSITDGGEVMDVPPPLPEVLRFQPRRNSHVSAVQQLFRLMDTNADGFVSWDEFSLFVLQAGQRHLLEALQRSALEESQKRNAAALKEAQASGDAAAAAAATSAAAGAPPPSMSGGAIQYSLTFTPTPTNCSPWQHQFPLVHHLYHKQPISRLIISTRSQRYITASTDGLVKLWRLDPRLCDAQKRTAIIHERNVVSTRAPITDMCLAPPSLGDAEVVALSAMDGTITLVRSATGEVVRTLLGVRVRTANQMAAMNEIQDKRNMDREVQEFEADDLLSLRNRQPVVAGNVVRMPYTVAAYHDDAMEIFFGPTNRYFQGLEVVATTFEHLKRPVSFSSDVLYNFGAERLTEQRRRREQLTGTTSKCWFASALALGRCLFSSSTNTITEGAYLFLGFEAGALQVYPVSLNWFCVTQISATRVEPPSGRRPVLSLLLHHAMITHIVVSERSDLVMTASEDGTVCVRSFSRLEVPMLTLGWGIPQFASPNLQLGNKEYVGHSKRLTCACWNEAHHLLVTGGMDHCLFFWNSRSPRPIRKIDLRDLQSSVAALANLGACGFPVDLSFMARDRDPLRLIVLDTRRVIRLFNALSGQFMGVLVDHSPASVALGEMLVVRYEANEDRLLLGGRCVRVWDIPREEEYAVDYYGHRKPILFTQWNASLKVFVTADEDHVVMWKLDLFPNEVAIQRRDERRRQRERAREKARKDALLRRHIKWDNTPIMDEAGDGVNEKKDDDEWERSTMDDEGSDWHSVATSQRTPATEIRPHTPTDEELGLPPESPEMLFMEQHLVTHERRDMNAFNHSFWTNQARMLRSWDVEAGIRAISMNGANITSGIYVALLREAAIVQYNSFNGAALRRFAFPNPVQDVFCLYAGEAVLNQSQGVSVPLLCGAYEVDMLSGLASIYHLSNGGNPMSGESIPVISDDPEQQPKSPKATPRGAAGSSIQPHRSLVSRGSPVTSVALIPSLGLVVLGTRGGLSVSPIADVTSYAIPCRTVMDSTDEKEDIERQKSVFGDDRSRRLSVGGTPIARCPTNLMALFPGRLVPIPPTEEELSHSGPDTHHRRRSTVFASTSASTNNPSSPVAGEGSRGSNTAATDAGGSTAAAADGVVTSSGSTPAAGAGDDGAEARILEGQASIMGFLGHLQAIRDTGYILSGSNDGMLQLWNLRSMSEILRFRLTLTVEAITSISISGKEGRSSAVASSAGASARSKGPSAEASSCYSGAAGADGPSIISRNGGFYAAVGDQSGYVVLLDFHMVPWNGLTPLDMLPAGWEKDIIVLDRWRAHRKDVRGICFIDSPDVHNEDRVGFGYNCPGMDVRQGMEAQEECFFANSHSYYLPLNPITLITSSEDSYVFVWRWQRGTLHCIGCFGGGAKTHIDPPLTQPSSHAERIFEEARMSYVIRRLATEMRMFAHSRPGPEELQLVLGFMEREFATLMVEDPVLVLSTWGSLADSSAEDEELKARKGSQLRMPKIDDCVFDRAGLLTVDYHAYLGAEMPGRGSNSSTPRSLTPAAAALMAAAAATPTLLPQTESPGPAELESHAFSEAGSNSAYFGTVGSTSSVAPQFHASRRLLSFQDEPITLSPNSIYVAAFMRGTYADNTVKECLLRTIDNVRHILRRIITSQKRRSSIRSFAAADRSSARRGRGSGFRSTVSPNTNNNSPRQTPQDAGEAASTRVSTGQQRGEGLEHENEVSAADASPTTSVSGARVNFLLEANTDTAPTFASPTPREAGGVDGEDDDDDDEEDNLHKPNSPSGTMPRLATAPNGADEVDLEEENSAAQAAAAVAADEEGEEEDEEADDGEGEDEEHEAAAAASPDLPSSPPSSHDTTTDGDKPKDDKEKPMHLRGVAGKPCFRLSYGDAGGLMSSKFLLTDQEVDEAHMKAILDGVPNPPRTPRGEMLPRILRKDTRVKAAFCTPADALSTTRVSEETARANSPFGGATSNLADLEDDEALAKQPASVVMQHAYLRRRREEAVQKILEVQLRELASKPKRSKAEEQKLAIEAGLIPLSTLKDFSDTHTSTVLYGTEQVMYESEAPKELVISDAFMKGVRTNIGRVNELEKDAPVRRKVRPERLLTPRSATTTPGQVEKAAQENEEDDDDDEEGGEAAGEGEDWYAERDRMKKRRKCRQALFNPARIMLTLLDWESPVPPNSRGAGAGNRVDDRGRCGSTEPWSTWTGSSTSEELLPSIFHLPEILPKSLVEEKGPMGRQNFGSTMPSSSVGGVTMMTATTATTTEGSVAPPPLNLNAMVAEEVDAMKERMRLSLEEREEFVRQMAVVKAARETEAELEAEDRPPGLGSSTTRPTAKDFGMSMISRPPTAQANQGQFVGNTRTQSLAEIRGKGRSRPRHARFAQ